MELNIGILGSFQLIKSINLHFWFGINKYRLSSIDADPYQVHLIHMVMVVFFSGYLKILTWD